MVNAAFHKWGLSMKQALKVVSGFVTGVALINMQLAFAQAAQLDAMSGKVLVNHGQGFASVAKAAQLAPGDKVLVGQDGRATLNFTTCTVTLSGANLYTVPVGAPCAAGDALAITNGVFVTPVAAPISQANQLAALDAKARAAQNAARRANDVVALSCINQRLNEVTALRHFIARNPGVDETGRISQTGAAIDACGHPMAPPVQAVAPPPPVAVVAAAPAVDSTMIAVGIGGLAVAGGAALLLIKKNCTGGVSAC
jgi:hypothetical protein